MLSDAFYISELIRAAMVNEKCIEEEICRRLSLGRFTVPFKVVYQSRFSGAMRHCLPALFVLATPFVIMFGLVLSAYLPLSGLTHGKGKPYKPNSVVLFATVRSNLSSLLNVTDLDKEKTIIIHRKDLNKFLASEISTLSRVCVAVTSLIVLIRLFFAKNFFQMALYLQFKDVAQLAMLCFFFKENSQLSVITDDHYQRWAYIFSKLPIHFEIVQHGAVPEPPPVSEAYGRLDTLYYLDFKSVSSFEAIYSPVRQKIKIQDSKVLSPSNLSGFVVFMASSLPYLDLEVAVCRVLKQKFKCTLAIKYHPAHQYPQYNALAPLADYIVDEETFIECDAFVSHSSTLSDVYHERGIAVFKISDYRSIEDLATDFRSKFLFRR